MTGQIVMVDLGKWKDSLLGLRLTAKQTSAVAEILRSSVASQYLEENLSQREAHC